MEMSPETETVTDVAQQNETRHDTHTGTALVPGVPAQGNVREMGTDFGVFLCAVLVTMISKKKKRSDILAVTLRELDEALGVFVTKCEGAVLIQQQQQLRPLIAHVIINRIDVVASTVNVTNNPLASLTEEDLSVLGQLLAPILFSESTSVAAVDQWIQRYPALGELDVAHAWFRPLVYEIAKKLKADMSWGANRRLYVGAALSMLDMGSDMYMIVVYWNTLGMERTGDILLNFLLANVAWQLMLVILQNLKAPWRVLFWEVLYVLTCTKVGIDVYRVASGAKRETYRSLSPEAELGE